MYVRMKYKNFTILHVAIQGARVDEECSIVRGRGEFLGTLLTILPVRAKALFIAWFFKAFALTGRRGYVHNYFGQRM